MPRREDIKKILIISSGPIIIGQACEFDYSGTQACKALREEGFNIVLVNSNPATIMTDPQVADRTYIEPITPDVVEKIIARERPDVLLPTLGGQTGLNTAVALAESGALDRYGVELIGAKLEAIQKAEDREKFKLAMEKIGLDLPKGGFAYNFDQAVEIIEDIGYPAIIRPSFTLGGTGGNIAYNKDQFEQFAQWGLSVSPIHEILIEESVIGWKEYELEVMRDLADNVVIICSIENFDPMGIHTGDSVTVAPAQTLTDKEYQRMRDAAIAIIREIGVETGGSNIQFAVHPDDGRLVVIEMNPRVSRSSALASKATGFPIAKIAAKLAVGYTLDEIPNDITKETPASFEPTIDYVVVKFPRWAFEKFPQADQTLTTQMKSVGEVMAIGRTFKEALQKSIRSLEIDRYSVVQDNKLEISKDEIQEKLRVPNWERVFYIASAFKSGLSINEIYNLTKIDRWFLYNIWQIVEKEDEIRRFRGTFSLIGEGEGTRSLVDMLNEAKRYGFSDIRLGELLGLKETEVRRLRKEAGIEATFKTVDTCAAEFEAYTPYYYSTYESEDEVKPSTKKKIMILGSGPNRIGQGIEFDYCCVHASLALREDGYETIMVNCNPETVSTDYDTSDRLYFEPLTFEDVMNIVDREKPDGVIVQFGGQTPLKLAIPLERAGVPIIGTSPESIDIAEDRERFRILLEELGIPQPASDTARSVEEALDKAKKIGYPVLVRPSYVLGGRAMEIVYNEESLKKYMGYAVEASPEHPVLIDKFLSDAIEIDVDAVADGERVVIGGIMQHIEQAGVHSGDSACVLPPREINKEMQDVIRNYTYALAKRLEVVGLMNVQYAIQNGRVYVLEVNPRASRTIPFVSKAIGLPLAKIAARVMAGKTLKELGVTKEREVTHSSVKEVVLPFVKFFGVDTLLGPEMRSTGEVMGIDERFGMAFAKAQIGAGNHISLKEGTVFISVRDEDRRAIVSISRELAELNFKLMAMEGTAKVLNDRGIPVDSISRSQGEVVLDHIRNRRIDLVINTPDEHGFVESSEVRKLALLYGIPYCTTIAAAEAVTKGIAELKNNEMEVRSLQEWHRDIE